MNVIGIALNELYRIFDVLNRDKFDGKLPEPVITIQKCKGKALGHFTTYKSWKNKNNKTNNSETKEKEEDSFYEINIDPRWFCNRTAVEVAETLLHEMCHYCNKMSNIKDCNGNIHNKKFKILAENVGLIVEKGESVGYGYTSLSGELENYINEVIKPDEDAFEYFRADMVKDSETKTRGKKTFKYTCPICGQEVKGKREINVKCGLCNIEMKMEDEEQGEDPDDASDDNKANML